MNKNERKKWRWWPMAGIVLLQFFMPVLCRAELIIIGLTGYVRFVFDDFNLLQNAVHKGDPITGFYVYDSTTPDSNPQSMFGEYNYTIAPYGMSLTSGNLTFLTDPANVNLTIGIVDNYGSPPPPGSDGYIVNSKTNLMLNNSLNLTMDNIIWQLHDYPGDALSSDTLPSTPPDLTQWGDNDLTIDGGKYPFPSPLEKTLFRIDGYVTDVYLIPEPMTMLFCLGGLVILRIKRT